MWRWKTGRLIHGCVREGLDLSPGVCAAEEANLPCPRHAGLLPHPCAYAPFPRPTHVQDAFMRRRRSTLSGLSGGQGVTGRQGGKEVAGSMRGIGTPEMLCTSGISRRGSHVPHLMDTFSRWTGASPFPQGMRHSFGKPAGKVARIEIGQAMISVRCKDVHQVHAIEALRRAKFKFPGRQKVGQTEGECDAGAREREGGRGGPCSEIVFKRGCMVALPTFSVQEKEYRP